MNRRHVGVAALTTVAALTLSACGGSNGASAPVGGEGAGGTITFVAAEYSAGVEPNWQDLITEFEDANPRYEVDLQVINWNDIDQQSIPYELEEAAALDGCSRLQVLRRVTLPLAMPGVVTAMIFTFIAAWNEFVVALTLTATPERQPLTVGVTSFVGQYQTQWQYLFAASLVAIIPVVLLFAAI